MMVVHLVHMCMCIISEVSNLHKCTSKLRLLDGTVFQCQGPGSDKALSELRQGESM